MANPSKNPVAEQKDTKKVYSLQIGDTTYKTTHDQLSVRGVLFLVDNYAKLHGIKRSDVTIKLDDKVKTVAQLTQFVQATRKIFGLAYGLQDTDENAKVAVSKVEEALKVAAKSSISFDDLGAGKFDGIVKKAGLDETFLSQLNLPMA